MQTPAARLGSRPTQKKVADVRLSAGTYRDLAQTPPPPKKTHHKGPKKNIEKRSGHTTTTTTTTDPYRQFETKKSLRHAKIKNCMVSPEHHRVRPVCLRCTHTHTRTHTHTYTRTHTHWRHFVQFHERCALHVLAFKSTPQRRGTRNATDWATCRDCTVMVF